MKNILITLFFIIFCAYTASSQGWVKVFGNDDYDNNPYRIYQIAINTKGEIYSIADYFNHSKFKGLYKTTDLGYSWLALPLENKSIFYSTDIGTRRIHVNSKDVVFVTFDDSTLIRSMNDGASFDTIFNYRNLKKIFNSTDSSFYKIKMDIAPNDALYISLFWDDKDVYTDNYHIIKSEDNGDTWSIVAMNTIPFNKLSFAKNGNVFTATNFSIYKSEDTCKTWKEIDIDSLILRHEAGWPGELEIDSEDNIYVIGETSRIIKSTDYGATWKGYYHNYFYNTFHHQIETSAKSNVLTSVAYSTDYGITWNDEQPFLHFILGTDSIAYAIEGQRYIYKFEEKIINVKEINNLSCFKIFPNPTDNIMNISFDILNPSYMEIMLIDESGKKILSMEKYFDSKGSNIISLNCSSCSSGSYYIWCKVNNEISTMKLIMIK